MQLLPPVYWNHCPKHVLPDLLLAEKAALCGLFFDCAGWLDGAKVALGFKRATYLWCVRRG